MSLDVESIQLSDDLTSRHSALNETLYQRALALSPRVGALNDALVGVAPAKPDTPQ